MLRLRELPVLLGQERAPTKTLGECLGIDAKSRSDPNGGNDAGVDISVDAGSAETEESSDFCHRERPFDPFDLGDKGNGWAEYVSHPTRDAAW